MTYKGTYVGKKKVKETKAQRVARQKRERAEEAARKNAEARALRDKVANSKVAKQNDKRRRQFEFVSRTRADWNVKINEVVHKVLNLRTNNPGRGGINAGNNSGIGNTDGGTENPVILFVPHNTINIKASDVLKGMHGLDNSDSGYYKFRRKGVLVHCK